MRKPRDKAVAAEVPATKKWAHSVVEGKPMHESEGCAKGGAGALAGGRSEDKNDGNNDTEESASEANTLDACVQDPSIWDARI